MLSRYTGLKLPKYRSKPLTNPAVSPAEHHEQATLRTGVVIGSPGTGKSTGIRHRILEAALKGHAVLVLDFHGSLIDDCLGDLLSRGFEQKIEFLDLNDPRIVFGLDLMPYPDQKDRELWLRDEDKGISDFAQILGRELGNETGADPMAGMMRGMWTRNFLRLMMRQRIKVSPRHLPYSLVIGHPIQERMLENCWDSKLAFEIRSVVEMKNLFQRESFIGATRRLIDPFSTNPSVDAILGEPHVDLTGWQRRGTILLVKSSPLVSEAATRGVFAALNMRYYQNCARHFAATGEPLPTDVFIDEALRLRPGKSESDMNEQGRKFGYAQVLILQRLPDTEDIEAILQSSEFLEIYGQKEAKAAELVAKQLTAWLYDPRRVKHETVRERTQVVGHKVEDKRSRTQGSDGRTSETTGSQLTPILEKVVETTPVFMSPQEFVAEWTGKVLALKKQPGKRYVIDGANVSEEPEQVIRLEPLWTPETTRRRLIEEALQRIRSRSHYHRPDTTEPTVPPLWEPAAEPKPKRGGAMK